MEQWVEIIKKIAIAQLFLLLLLIIMIYIIKMISQKQHYRQAQFINRTKHQFQQAAHQIITFQSSDWKQYRKYLALLLPIIKETDKTVTTVMWQQTRDQLMTQLLLPFAHKAKNSTQWYQRYLACQVFQLFLPDEEIDAAALLLKDDFPLVALNATRIALQQNSQALIDAMIDNFSQNRRLQDALFLQANTIESHTLPLVTNRINREQDPYIRVFCYRILSTHPSQPQMVDDIETDLDAANIDLQIAAINYQVLTHPQQTTPLLHQKLHNPHWEIRAKAAQLMGKIGDLSALTLLNQSLRDTSWWVRMNSAEALAQLGPSGIAILEQQSPSIDQFAYDVAKRILAKIQIEPSHE